MFDLCFNFGKPNRWPSFMVSLVFPFLSLSLFLFLLFLWSLLNHDNLIIESYIPSTTTTGWNSLILFELLNVSTEQTVKPFNHNFHKLNFQYNKSFNQMRKLTTIHLQALTHKGIPSVSLSKGEPRRRSEGQGIGQPALGSSQTGSRFSRRRALNTICAVRGCHWVGCLGWQSHMSNLTYGATN